jgi:hypothetical protein
MINTRKYHRHTTATMTVFCSNHNDAPMDAPVTMPSDADIHELNQLAFTAGIFAEIHPEEDNLVVDLTDFDSYRRFLAILFSSPEICDCLYADLQDMETDIMPVSRDLDPLGSFIPPGLPAHDAAGAIVTVRPPLKLWTWIREQLCRCADCGRHDNELTYNVPVVGTRSDDVVRERRAAAMRCVEAFGTTTTFAAHDAVTAAQMIEDKLFDAGRSEEDVRKMFVNAALLYRCGWPWAFEDGGSVDIRRVIRLSAEKGIFWCFCGTRCEVEVPTKRILDLQCAATTLAEHLDGMLDWARDPDAIFSLARQLARGWTPMQLLRAAYAYCERWPAEFSMLPVAFLFGHRFDVFDPDRHFLGRLGTYQNALADLPWYPDEPTAS